MDKTLDDLCEGCWVLKNPNFNHNEQELVMLIVENCYSWWRMIDIIGMASITTEGRKTCEGESRLGLHSYDDTQEAQTWSQSKMYQSVYSRGD
eukprot:scaffold6966_cov112-Cylindrotheca_fusiformis.AAC.33